MMRNKTRSSNEDTTLDKHSASYGELSTHSKMSFLGVTDYTDTLLWLLNFLSVKDLLSIKLLSKSHYHAFYDPQIFFPLKMHILLRADTVMDSYASLLTTERNRRQKADRFDKEFKFICCQSWLSHCILCCYTSRNIRSDYEFSDNQFRDQKLFLYSIAFALVSTLYISVISLFITAANRKDIDDPAYMLSVAAVSTSFSIIFLFGTGCWAYTSCYRPLSHYCIQVSKLRDIQKDIKKETNITHRLFETEETVSFNNDSSETSHMEEGLLPTFDDETKSHVEIVERNSTVR